MNETSCELDSATYLVKDIPLNDDALDDLVSDVGLANNITSNTIQLNNLTLNESPEQTTHSRTTDSLFEIDDIFNAGVKPNTPDISDSIKKANEAIFGGEGSDNNTDDQSYDSTANDYTIDDDNVISPDEILHDDITSNNHLEQSLDQSTIAQRIMTIEEEQDTSELAFVHKINRRLHSIEYILGRPNIFDEYSVPILTTTNTIDLMLDNDDGQNIQNIDDISKNRPPYRAYVNQPITNEIVLRRTTLHPNYYDPEPIQQHAPYKTVNDYNYYTIASEPLMRLFANDAYHMTSKFTNAEIRTMLQISDYRSRWLWSPFNIYSQTHNTNTQMITTRDILPNRNSFIRSLVPLLSYKHTHTHLHGSYKQSSSKSPTSYKELQQRNANININTDTINDFYFLRRFKKMLDKYTDQLVPLLYYNPEEHFFYVDINQITFVDKGILRLSSALELISLADQLKPKTQTVSEDEEPDRLFELMSLVKHISKETLEKQPKVFSLGMYIESYTEPSVGDGIDENAAESTTTDVSTTSLPTRQPFYAKFICYHEFIQTVSNDINKVFVECSTDRGICRYCSSPIPFIKSKSTYDEDIEHIVKAYLATLIIQDDSSLKEVLRDIIYRYIKTLLHDDINTIDFVKLKCAVAAMVIYYIVQNTRETARYKQKDLVTLSYMLNREWEASGVSSLSLDETIQNKEDFEDLNKTCAFIANVFVKQKSAKQAVHADILPVNVMFDHNVFNFDEEQMRSNMQNCVEDNVVREMYVKDAKLMKQFNDFVEEQEYLEIDNDLMLKDVNMKTSAEQNVTHIKLKDLSEDASVKQECAMANILYEYYCPCGVRHVYKGDDKANIKGESIKGDNTTNDAKDTVSNAECINCHMKRNHKLTTSEYLSLKNNIKPHIFDNVHNISTDEDDTKQSTLIEITTKQFLSIVEKYNKYVADYNNDDEYLNELMSHYKQQFDITNASNVVEQDHRIYDEQIQYAVVVEEEKEKNNTTLNIIHTPYKYLDVIKDITNIVGEVGTPEHRDLEPGMKIYDVLKLIDKKYGMCLTSKKFYTEVNDVKFLRGMFLVLSVHKNVNYNDYLPKNVIDTKTSIKAISVVDLLYEINQKDNGFKKPFMIRCVNNRFSKTKFKEIKK